VVPFYKKLLSESNLQSVWIVIHEERIDAAIQGGAAHPWIASLRSQ
jgi:hypothetical protein